ncbi:RNA 2',3'-cyclic phosphodiesterase [Cellulomonas composti]|uniref:RNA 2',3'-cyclic phosphodiesterase n=1 Tax=Cellulomonas composti TaxID=266130 RepID=A0A511J878_9CELL|nr:RNA 2',3'-cyclic phosphodiesterase [Cellulomonas composti]GEL94206.1 RNA 2',3'-cyclic phosphodiesterase [Cellulomonas composti]
MRVFAAVWPPDDVLDHLDLALASVRGGPAGTSSAVRWSARETWHLTTAFYGEVPDGAVPTIATTLAEAIVDLEPYRLTLRGSGVFAHRTLWVGAGGDLEPHRRVVEACAEAGAAVGAPDDRRERERAHLTVGRSRPGSAPPRRRSSRPGPDEDPVAGLVRALAVYEGPSWLVEEVVLVESRPGAGRGGGPLYLPIERVVLGR